MPEISIIVPIFNAAETLPSCLSSILAQTFTDWELLLIDDASTDNSLSVCRHFEKADPRIQVWTQPHGGISSARNVGLKLMKGYFLCFVDADDHIEPDFLEKLYRFKNYDLVICGYYTDLISQDGTTCQQKKYLPTELEIPSLTDRKILVPLFISGMINFCWNKLLRTRIIRDHHIEFESIPIHEDYGFVLDYLGHCRSIKSIPLPLYHWTHLDGKKSAKSLFSDQLLSYYLDAHRATTRFFQSKIIAGDILYYSYFFIILKHFERIVQTRHLKIQLNTVMDHPLVQEAFQFHRPSSKGESFMLFLLRHRFYKLFYHIHLWLVRNKK